MFFKFEISVKGNNTLTERTSTYRMTKWSVNESAIEAMSHKLDHGGIVISD